MAGWRERWEGDGAADIEREYQEADDSMLAANGRFTRAMRGVT